MSDQTFDIEEERAARRTMCSLKGCEKPTEGLWQAVDRRDPEKEATLDFCSYECARAFEEGVADACG